MTGPTSAHDLCVFGSADDLIEVRGAVRDELSAAHGEPTCVSVTAHTPQGDVTASLQVEYGDDDVWMITETTPSGLVTIVPARGDDAGNDADGCPGYSQKAVVRGGYAVTIAPVGAVDEPNVTPDGRVAATRKRAHAARHQAPGTMAAALGDDVSWLLYRHDVMQRHLDELRDRYGDVLSDNNDLVTENEQLRARVQELKSERRLDVRDPTKAVLQEVAAERARQDVKWGEQNHPDGTGSKGQQDDAERARAWCQDAFGCGYGTWEDILREEVAEAFAERDRAALRSELIQVAAVAVCWAEAIDRRDNDSDSRGDTK